MLEFSAETGLWGLFVSSFVSATILPGNSEVVLLALLLKFPASFWELIAVATFGNTLGGMTSYALGRFLPRKIEHRSIAWLQRHGEWLLLFSWVPVIGDALCVAAGWLRFNPALSLLMIAIGKCARYLVLAMGLGWVNAKIFA